MRREEDQRESENQRQPLGDPDDGDRDDDEYDDPFRDNEPYGAPLDDGFGNRD